MTAHVLLDTGFDAARFASACKEAGGRLHYIALAELPVDTETLAPAWRAQWPMWLAGVHRMVSPDGRITLDLWVGEINASLTQLSARVQQVYLAQWPSSLTVLARLLTDGARLTAPQFDSAQRVALEKASFVFDKCGEQAVFRSRRPQPAPVSPVRRAVVIGAGVAGAAACERLAARGWQVTLIERHAQMASEASGNLAGIFMPQLSRDDNPGTRLVRAAFLHALRTWQRLGGVGTAFDGAQSGVLQLARDAAHADVQRQIAAAHNYPPQFARWLEAPEASGMLGAAAPHGAWWFAGGGWARPACVCAAMLDACGAQLERRFSTSALRLDREGDCWLVRDEQGAVIASAPTVILAGGTGAIDFAQAASLPLAAVRGQVTHLAEGTLPALPFVLCREAYMTPPSQGMVCVGATYDMDSDPQLRLASQQDNLAKISAILQRPVFDAPLAGRTGFRCVAPDRLPLVGALPDPGVPGRCERLRDLPRWPGLHGLLGYASRGLIWAPLAAELLASELEGEPLPLEASLAAALDPGRFLLRERRGGRP